MVAATLSLFVPARPASASVVAQAARAPDVHVVPDLTGDGSADVLDIRVGTRTSFTVRDGRTGGARWTRDLDEHEMRQFGVGSLPDGRRGLVVLGVASTESTRSVEWSTYDDSGRLLARVTLEGAYDAVTERRVPEFSGFVTDGAGAVRGAVVAVRTTAYVGATAVTSADVVVLRPGDSAAPDPVAQAAGTGSTPRAFAGPSGAPPSAGVTVPEQDGTGAVELRDGTTGAVRWRAEAVPLSASPVVQRLADGTGDGVGELAVSASGLRAIGVSLGGVMEPVVTLLDGATGAVLWTRSGKFAYSLDSRVVVVPEFPRGDRHDVVLTAYDARGRVLFRRTVDTLPAAEGDGVSRSVEPVGDLDSDGVLDLGYLIAVVRHNGDVVERRGLADGRTGRRVRLDDGLTLGQSVDSRGADLADVSGATVTVRDGQSARLVWSATVTEPDVQVSSVRARELTGDRCADVVVAATAGAAPVLMLVDGATGSTRWAIHGDARKPVSVKVRRAGPTCAAATATASPTRPVRPARPPRALPTTGADTPVWPVLPVTVALLSRRRRHRGE